MSGSAPPPQWDSEADVLIAGAGVAGGYTNEAGYRSGWHLTNAFVFGRVAGRNIAAEQAWA